MRWIDGLTKGQRIVLVIAFGVALETLGSYLVGLGSWLAVGWYGYSPLSGGGFSPSTGLHGWLRLIIWLVLIGVWTLGSIRLLRPSAVTAPSREPASPSGD